MLLTRATAVVVLAACVIAGAAPAAGQTTTQEALMKEMQERMAEAARPGPHHAALGEYVGQWDVELAMVMPGVPAMRSKGTATYAWAIPGRWLTQQITGELMGSPYQSFSLMGFDNYAKNHVVVTVSSMDTAMNMARGLVVDPTHKVTAVYGTLDEYTTAELHKPYKVIVRKASDARHVMEVWDLGIGESGAKVLEFTFTRRR